jgi:hypothetical protein
MHIDRLYSPVESTNAEAEVAWTILGMVLLYLAQKLIDYGVHIIEA